MNMNKSGAVPSLWRPFETVLVATPYRTSALYYGVWMYELRGCYACAKTISRTPMDISILIIFKVERSPGLSASINDYRYSIREPTGTNSINAKWAILNQSSNVPYQAPSSQRWPSLQRLTIRTAIHLTMTRHLTGDGNRERLYHQASAGRAR